MSTALSMCCQFRRMPCSTTLFLLVLSAKCGPSRLGPWEHRCDFQADGHALRWNRADARPRILRPYLERLAAVDLLSGVEHGFDRGDERRGASVHLPEVEHEEQAESHRVAVHLERSVAPPLHEPA